ncbi:histidinol-phosphate/aromatic aminotransferase/cobyric acid decarboxylase-like protein [Kitasatospora paracochleata]|uniref:Histidinol-phosphate/aromatic aminotransferase/cobyric acid decarboxylase-like protein n=1 Tax=Kitasatospora paracochleata TaxID=58354 RepID=A0ABT1ISI6_9ACTN|nr:histidinol-phosphate/aromatic aminotransferase/cobyric acid decarboxylase-like protein [Kitasatospora paracochleata]
MSPEPDLRHHGDAEVRTPGLVDLAVNVRTGTPPDWLRERLAATLGDLAAYPDGTAARAAVAARHRRPVAEVLLTSGAAEAFVLLARVLRPRCWPAYRCRTPPGRPVRPSAPRAWPRPPRWPRRPAASCWCPS